MKKNIHFNSIFDYKVSLLSTLLLELAPISVVSNIPTPQSRLVGKFFSPFSASLAGAERQNCHHMEVLVESPPLGDFDSQSCKINRLQLTFIVYFHLLAKNWATKWLKPC